jgi:hypothetical protein
MRAPTKTAWASQRPLDRLVGASDRGFHRPFELTDGAPLHKGRFPVSGSNRPRPRAAAAEEAVEPSSTDLAPSSTRSTRNAPAPASPAPPEATPNTRRGDSCHRRANDQRLARAAAVESAPAAPPTSGLGSSPSAFTRLVLRRIQSVSSSRLAAATGLSPGYCALVRRGDRIPAPHDWAAFQLARSASCRVALREHCCRDLEPPSLK